MLPKGGVQRRRSTLTGLPGRVHRDVDRDLGLVARRAALRGTSRWPRPPASESAGGGTGGRAGSGGPATARVRAAFLAMLAQEVFTPVARCGPATGSHAG